MSEGGETMAVQEVRNSQLRLVLQVGTDEEGNPIFRNKNFNNIKPNATAEQLYAIATSLSVLQEHDLYEIVRNDSSTLSEA